MNGLCALVKDAELITRAVGDESRIRLWFLLFCVYCD